MAITRYAGDRFTINTSDTKPTGVLDGAYLIDTGNLTQWVRRTAGGTSQWNQLAGGGGGGGTPGGANTQVQFNNAGAFGGDADLTFTDGNRLNVNKLGISGNIYDSNNSIGNNGMVLTNEGTTGVNWKNIESVLSGVGGSGVANYVARWSDEDTITTGVLVDNGTNVGIGTAAPEQLFEISATGDAAIQFQSTKTSLANNDPIGSIIFKNNDSSGSNPHICGKIASIAETIYGRAGLAFSTGRTSEFAERMRIRWDGNIGIGTDQPNAKLQIDYAIATEVGLRLRGTGTGTKTWQISEITGNAGTLTFRNATDSVNAVSIKSDGNVGIGTTVPAVKLHVAGDIKSKGDGKRILLESDDYLVAALTRQGTSGSAADQGGLEIYNAGTTKVALFANTTSYINNGANFGIGTNAPSGKLHIRESNPGSFAYDSTADTLIVEGNGNAGITIATAAANTSRIIFASPNDATGAEIKYSDATSLMTIGNTSPDDSLAFQAGNGVEAVRIISGGNVGIGTTSPTRILHVQGTTSIVHIESSNANANASVWFKSNVGGTVADRWEIGTNISAGSSLEIYDRLNSASRMVIKNDGNVGIGTISPSGKLHILSSDLNNNLILESNETGGSTAPDLVLYRSSTSAVDNDYIGVIRFRGKNDNATPEDVEYGAITSQIKDSTDGEEDGELALWTMEGGTLTQQVTLNSVGNIGINNTSPEHRLHVVGDAIISGYLYDSTNSTGVDGYVLTSKEDGPQWKMIEDVLSGVGGNGTATYIPQWIDSDTIGDSVMVQSGSAIGIGTDAPDYTLDVAGDIGVNQYIRHNGDPDTHINFTDDDINFKVGNVNFLDLTQDTVSEMTVNEAGANLDVRMEGDTDANLFFLDASTNKIGIGTNSPANTLHVQKDVDDFVVKLENDGNSTSSDGLWLDTRWNTASNTVLKVTSNSGSADYFYIKGDGKVGIGTTSPSVKLHVVGSGTDDGIKVHSGTNVYLELDSTDSSTTREVAAKYKNYSTGTNFWWTGLNQASRYDFAYGTTFINANIKVSILTDGNVGIGTAQPGAARLDIYHDGGFTDDLPTARIYHRNNPDSGNSRVAALDINVGMSNSDLFHHGYVQLYNHFTGGPYDSPKLYFSSNSYNSSTNHRQWWGIQALADTTATGDRLAFTCDLSSANPTATPVHIMSLLTAGNVGIGVVAPDNYVHIRESALSSRPASNSNTSLTIEHATDTGIQFFSATQTQIRFGDAASTAAGAIIYEHGDNNFKLNYTDHLTINGSSGENVRFLNNGNVGIGTTSPDYLLHVQGTGPDLLKLKGTTSGSAGAPKILFEHSSGGAQTASIIFDQSGENKLLLSTQRQSATDENLIQFAPADNVAMTIRGGTGSSDGFVGIGTVSPDSQLHVLGDTLKLERTNNAPALKLYNNNASPANDAALGYLQFTGKDNDGTANMVYSEVRGGVQSNTNSAVSGYLSFLTTNNGTSVTEAMRIQADGTLDIKYGIVNIGTANSSSAHINSYELMTFNIDTDNDDTNRYFGFYANGASGGGTELVRILEDGKVGIGTTAPSGKLHILQSGTYAATGVSDAALHIKATHDYPMNIVLDADGSSSDDNRIRFLKAGADKWQWNVGEDIVFYYRVGGSSWGSGVLKIASTGAITFNNAYTFPTAIGSAGQVLKVPSSGTVLEWSTETGPVSGTGTNNYLTRWTGTNSVGNSNIFDNGTIGIGTAANLNGKVTIREAGNSATPNHIFCMLSSSAVGHGASIFLKTSTTNTNNRYGARITSIRNANNNAAADLAFSLENTAANALDEVVRFTSDGCVGIGTTAPGQKLHVNGSAEIDGSIYLNDTNTRIHEGSGNSVRLETNSGYVDIGPQNASYCHIQTDRDRFYFNKELVVDSGIIRSYNEDLQFDASYSGAVAKNIILRTGNVEKIRMNTDGNLGIGTTGPAAKLDVRGNILRSGLTYSSWTSRSINSITSGSSTINYILIAPKTTTNVRLSGRFNCARGSGVSAVSIAHADIVFCTDNDANPQSGGIHSASSDIPSYGHANFEIVELEYSSTEYYALKISPSSSWVASFNHIEFEGIANSITWTNIDSGNVSNIGAFGGSQAVFAYKHANVGIGTDSPSARLHITSDGSHDEGAEIVLRHANNNSTDVVSTLSFQNNGGQVAMIQAGTTSGNTNGYISLFTDNSGTSAEKMRIISDGNIGIGTTDPGVTLDVRGELSIGSPNASYDLYNNGTTYLNDNVTIDALLSITGTAASQSIINSSTTDSAAADSYLNIFKTAGSGGGSRATLRVGYDATACFQISRIRNDANIYINSRQSGSSMVFQIADNEQMSLSSGQLKFPDSKKIIMGAGNDLQIYHDGDNWIDANGAGDLYLRNLNSSGDVIVQAGASGDAYIKVHSGETALKATNNGAVELYYNNTKTFQTTASGVKLTQSTSYLFGGDDEILAGQDSSGYYFATGNGQNVNKPIFIGDNASYIQFKTSDVEVVRIDANGNVGIGTTNPGSYKLLVNGNSYLDGTAYVDGLLTVDGDIDLESAGQYITFYGNSSADHSISSRNSSGNAADDLRINTYGALFINLDSNGNNTSGADFSIGRHGGTGAISASDWLLDLSGETGKLRLYKYGSGTHTGTAAHQLAVDSSGNIIETTDGGGNVSGSGTSGKLTKWSGANALTDSSFFSESGTTLTNTATLTNFSANNATVTLSAYGRLGVGTNSATSPFISYLGNNSTWDGDHALIRAFNGGNRGAKGHGDGSNLLKLDFNDACAMIVNKDGSVGIGTTAPTKSLDVNESAYFNDDIYFGNTVLNPASGFSNQTGMGWDKSAGQLQIAANGTAALEVGRHTSTGTVFSVRYASTQKASIDSSGNMSLAGTLTEASSLALKENIEDFTPRLDIINKIRPVKYNKKKESKKEIGLIAEELAELFPELVEKDKNGNPSGVNYSRAVTVLLGGFKELYKEVQELKKRI